MSERKISSVLTRNCINQNIPIVLRIKSHTGIVRHEASVDVTTISPARRPFPPMELAIAKDARATGADDISVTAISGTSL